MAINVSIIFMFILYLAFMLSVGIYFYKKGEINKDLSGYILGGRGLNSWVAAMSAGASDMSGWLLMGLPGAAYVSGYSAGWIGIGLAIGTYLNWKFVAKRLRVYTEIAGDSITLSDYFENRFRDNSRILRVLSAIFILLFFFVYTSSGFVAGAKLFNTVFGLPYTLALIVGVAVILSYTVLGGFLAVSWTDFFQGTLMFIALVGVPIGIFSALGGIGDTMDSIRSLNPNLLNLFRNPDGSSLGFWATVSLLAWGFGYFGQPHILTRFMAIKSAKAVKKATWIGMVWVIISLFCAVLIGTIGIVFLKDAPLQGSSVEKVFMVLIQAVFHPLVAGVFLAAILAAVMSTADSQLLVTSSSFTKDFYQVFLKKDATDKQLVNVSRMSVAIVAVVAFIIALNPENKVLDLVSYAWGGLGASFGPIVLMSLYWRDMTRNGAIAGMITGGLTVIIWHALSGGLFNVYELLPGFVFGCLAIYIVSKLGKKPSKEIQNEFDKVIALVNEE